MTDYVAHKLRLKCKLFAKRKLKAPLPPSVVVHKPVVVAGDQPPAKPASPCFLPTIVTYAPDSVAMNQSSLDVVSQVMSLFASFAESSEAKFSSIDQRFIQVISCSASNISDRVNVICQDVVSNHSLAAPTPVAVHHEHPPGRAPSVSYSDNLGTILGGPAAVSASLDASSLSRMSFADFVTMMQFFELSSGRVPDSFLDSLCAYVVVAPEFDLAIGGSSITDSIRAYRLCLSNPANPVPGLFHVG